MTNLLERSILMTLGAAMLTKEMAESLADSLAQKGDETTALGRESVDEVVGKAKEEARSLRGRFDNTLQRNFREMGLAPSAEIEELKLKVAQLEHRISLLEAGNSATGSSEKTTGETQSPEGVIGEAAVRAPEQEKPSPESKSDGQANQQSTKG
ncbi:MAG: phasin family protein [Thermoleophilia bacterium]